jgi:hypothetical protein
VYVSRGSNGGGPGTLLSYYYFATNPTINQFVEYGGYGQIPNEAFQVEGNNFAVKIDTSTIPGFYNYYCNTAVCPGLGTGGPVSGTWTQMTSHIGTKSSGSFTSTTPGATYKSNGTSEFNAASSNVNVLGVTATGVSGNVGTQHETTITVQHN